MARGGHGFPKVSPGAAILKPLTPCGRATPERLKQPYGCFRGGPPTGEQPAAVVSHFGHPTPCAYGKRRRWPEGVSANLITSQTHSFHSIFCSQVDDKQPKRRRLFWCRSRWQRRCNCHVHMPRSTYHVHTPRKRGKTSLPRLELSGKRRTKEPQATR
jgi:hypothetical protein